jgi:hypothetical protein
VALLGHGKAAEPMAVPLKYGDFDENAHRTVHQVLLASIHISQPLLRLKLSNLALFSKKVKLTLLINYIFVVYFEYLLNRDLFANLI